MTNVTWDASNKSGGVTFSGLTANAPNQSCAVATSGQSAGKFYFEFTLGSTVGVSDQLGLMNGPVISSAGGNQGVNFNVTSTTAGTIRVSSSDVLSLGTFTAIGSGTVLCFAVDLDNQTFWIKPGTAANWNNSGTANPATNTGGGSFAALGPKGISLIPHAYFNSGTRSITANFGDTAFSGTVPSGFTSGLPTDGANNALVTQIGAEVWRAAPSAARITQIGAEVWRSVTTLTALAVPAGSIVFTGFAPTPVNNGATAIPAGSIVFTGLAPNSDVTSVVPVGALVFTGYAPTPVNNAATAVPVGSIVLTGQTPGDPVVTSDIPAGSIVLTGQAPSVNAADIILGGEILFTGYAPVLEVASDPIPAGSIAFTGFAPTVVLGSAGSAAFVTIMA